MLTQPSQTRLAHLAGTDWEERGVERELQLGGREAARAISFILAEETVLYCCAAYCATVQAIRYNIY